MSNNKRQTLSKGERNRAVLSSAQKHDGMEPIIVYFGEEYGIRRYAVRYTPKRQEGEPLRKRANGTDSPHTQRQYDALSEIEQEIIRFQSLPVAVRRVTSLAYPLGKEREGK